MKPFDANALLQFMIGSISPGLQLFSVVASYDIRNNRLARLLLEGGADLHGQPDAEIEGFVVYLWWMQGVVRFSMFDEGTAEARTEEADRLLNALDGGMSIDDRTACEKVGPNPAFTIVSCVRLRTKDGRHSVALYYNTSLTLEEAIGFAKRAAAEASGTRTKTESKN